MLGARGARVHKLEVMREGLADMVCMRYGMGALLGDRSDGAVSPGGAKGVVTVPRAPRERYNLLSLLGQFVHPLCISAYQRCIRNPDTLLLYQKKYVVSAMYQRCISDVSVNCVISS